jgi:putative ABC transport system permease protein
VKQKIAPLMMLMGGNYGGLVVKIKTADVKGFLSSLKKQWASFNPPGPLGYNFLDDKFASLYANEKRTQQIFSVFAILAIIIACLGLFGLATYTAEQRRKEIGIRKVLGASVGGIIQLLSKEFLKLVLVAFVIAIPISWWAMNEWLQDFAYRINIGWWVFAAAGTFALLITLVTISFQAIRAALANPVKSLRTE